jgi:hypothetical protein
MSKMETPVNLDTVRAQLKPIFNDLNRTLSTGQKQYSPAWSALQDVMGNGQSQMPAMDFDKFLSAVKSISRDGNSPLLSTQSQRLAKQVIASGEKSFQDAISDAGPNVADKLNRARTAVKEYYNTSDFLNDLQTEPAALYSNLTAGGDRVADTLKYLKQKSPAATDTVARTFLNEMMDKATREGGWGRSAGVSADWNRMGPQTKALLYGPELTKSLDNFFRAAKTLTPAMGSPTADRLTALASYGDIGAAIGEFAIGASTGHPLIGAAGAAATLARTRAYPALLASLSFKPAGAELLRQAITLPTDSPAFARTMQALTAMAQATATKRPGSSGKPDYTDPRAKGVVANRYQPGGGILAADFPTGAPVPPSGIGATGQ